MAIVQSSCKCSKVRRQNCFYPFREGRHFHSLCKLLLRYHELDKMELDKEAGLILQFGSWHI